MKLTNPEAESLLLSSLLRSLPKVGALCVEKNLTRADFSEEANGQLYVFLLGEWSTGQAIERFRMITALKSYGLVGAVGGVERVTHLFTLSSVEAATPDYVAAIKDCALRRRLLSVCGEAHLNLQGEVVTDEIVSSLKSALDTLNESAAVETPSAEELTREVCDRSIGTGLIPTHFRCIDSKCGGVRPGDMLVIAGQAKAGKSSLAANIARKVSQHGFVAIFTIEMNRAEYWKRMLCAEASVPTVFFDLTDSPPKHQEDRMNARIPIMSALPLTIIDRVTDIDQAITIAAMLKQKHGGLAAVVFDYLQLFSCEALKGASSTAMVSGISSRIKRAATALQTLAIVPCQLNDDGRALDSRAAERDCNMMISINRDEKSGERSVHVGFNRNGPMNIPLPLKAELHFNRFVEDGNADA